MRCSCKSGSRTTRRKPPARGPARRLPSCAVGHGQHDVDEGWRRPGTDVEPTWSSRSTRSPRTCRTCAASRSKRTGQSGSYGTRRIGPSWRAVAPTRPPSSSRCRSSVIVPSRCPGVLSFVRPRSRGALTARSRSGPRLRSPHHPFRSSRQACPNRPIPPCRGHRPGCRHSHRQRPPHVLAERRGRQERRRAHHRLRCPDLEVRIAAEVKDFDPTSP